MANFKKGQHNPRLMLDYNEVYTGLGERVVYYLNQANDLGNQTIYKAQKVRLVRLANLAWILMNQPADKDGCISLRLEDILDMLSKGKDGSRISTGVLRGDMRDVGAGIDIRFIYDPNIGKMFINPMKVTKAK